MSHHQLPVLSSDSSLSQYIQDIKRFPMLDADEEYMLAKRWLEHGDYAAAHKLVTSHLRLVAKIAYNFRGYGLPMQDVIAEGNIGLMQAVKKFDPERGFRLSTYAIWWIRAAVQEYILRSWSLVKVGSSAGQKRLFFNLRKMKTRLLSYDQKTLDHEQITEIAQELNVHEQDVIDMDQRMSSHDPYLHMVVGEGGTTELIDTLSDDRALQEETLGNAQELSQKQSLLAIAMQTLNPRERDIIQQRRLQDEPTTLEDLSRLYNISRERVRQIEARAMEKLTQHMLNPA